MYNCVRLSLKEPYTKRIDKVVSNYPNTFPTFVGQKSIISAVIFYLSYRFDSGLWSVLEDAPRWRGTRFNNYFRCVRGV